MIEILEQALFHIPDLQKRLHPVKNCPAGFCLRVFPRACQRPAVYNHIQHIPQLVQRIPAQTAQPAGQFL